MIISNQFIYPDRIYPPPIYFITAHQRMNQPLKETNANLPRNQNKNYQKQKTQIQHLSIEDVMAVSLSSIDFGDCVCGTVHERKLGIIMLTPQEQPRIITLRILFEDQCLSDLPEYIFGVRKENTFEYFDQYKFKAMQKGVYNFVVGVKTPMIADYPVQGRLQLTFQGAKNMICVPLSQVPRVPEIKCSRELVNEEGVRLIKLGVVKNKSRKEVKVAFKCNENLTINLMAELIGLGSQEEGEVEVKPKNFQVGGKGVFLLSFLTNGPSELQNASYCVRKILVLRVKDTKIHFHFPLEVTFYPGSQNSEVSSIE